MSIYGNMAMSLYTEWQPESVSEYFVGFSDTYMTIESVALNEYENTRKLLEGSTIFGNDRRYLQEKADILLEISFKEIGQRIVKVFKRFLEMIKTLIKKIKEFFTKKKVKDVQDKAQEAKQKVIELKREVQALTSQERLDLVDKSSFLNQAIKQVANLMKSSKYAFYDEEKYFDFKNAQEIANDVEKNAKMLLNFKDEELTSWAREADKDVMSDKDKENFELNKDMLFMKDFLFNSLKSLNIDSPSDIGAKVREIIDKDLEAELQEELKEINSDVDHLENINISEFIQMINESINEWEYIKATLEKSISELTKNAGHFNRAIDSTVRLAERAFGKEPAQGGNFQNISRDINMLIKLLQTELSIIDIASSYRAKNLSALNNVYTQIIKIIDNLKSKIAA